MDPFAPIRNLYAPIQPTIRSTEKNVTYHEFLPHQSLRNFIYCYWQLKTIKTLANTFNYRVVSDGCIDIFFEPANPNNSFVMGFCRKYTEFPLDNSFNYVGVRFLPTMFPQFFGISAAALSNRYENLDNVAPTTSNFVANHMDLSQSTDQIIFNLDMHFLKLLSHTNFNVDTRLYGAIHLILQNHGVLRIEDDLDVGLSPRQLRRLFRHYIGATPKTFSKVVQFQNILRSKPSKQSLKQNKLFYDIGYYDQAHFIKDFKNFYGVTPMKAFNR